MLTTAIDGCKVGLHPSGAPQRSAARQRRAAEALRMHAAAPELVRRTNRLIFYAGLKFAAKQHEST
jgi:hypothetical protein